ncbi:lysine--tRNA ligase [Candidatus Peregrinibacteria bacterium]|nr:lysine--tRNA ligase [Candidatus Peregrinibacteria bacterium]
MNQFRLQKAQIIRQQGMQPYASSFDRTHTLMAARALNDEEKTVIAGRVVLLRDMGKMTFLALQDHTGRLQIAMKEEDIGKGKYKEMLHLLDLGDFIGIRGKRFTTQKGEPTVRASEWTMLSKALRQPPEKWHGIADQETAWRQRYLDTVSNRGSFDRFIFRSAFLKKLREFYWSHEFVEVETPVLVNAASGALAKPFTTHHEAYDLDVFLRIAPETFLKECLIGGFDRVFEVARVFRNEGLDPSHLQDFTMVEHYAAYWDYLENMKFTEKMLSSIIGEMLETTKTKIHDRNGKSVAVDFATPWPRMSIRQAIIGGCDIDIAKSNSRGALMEAMKKESIRLDVPTENLSMGNLIDQLYKKVCRPNFTSPVFITDHPIELSPLARRNDDNPDITDRFQLVVGGWEVVNAYSELIDPMDQARRFDEQDKANAGGDNEAHRKDDEFVTALEYGCPPCSGWGMGVDRIVALLTQQTNLRDVVLFPLMKPLAKTMSPFLSQKSEPNPTPNPNPNPPSSLPPQHLEYGHLLPAAHGLLSKHADKTRSHLIATGAAMEAFAKKFGGDTATWRIAGMLHDLDWDHLEKDMHEHCGKTLEQMLAEIKSPKELLEDIRSHYAEKYGAEHPLESMLRKCLYCVDELTGLIIAVTLVRPSKKIADVEVSSIKKKMKDKSFAAQVSREQIRKCEELLGVPLDEMIQLTLEAMKGVAREMGL